MELLRQSKLHRRNRFDPRLIDINIAAMSAGRSYLPNELLDLITRHIRGMFAEEINVMELDFSIKLLRAADAHCCDPEYSSLNQLSKIDPRAIVNEIKQVISTFDRDTVPAKYIEILDIHDGSAYADWQSNYSRGRHREGSCRADDLCPECEDRHVDDLREQWVENHADQMTYEEILDYIDTIELL